MNETITVPIAATYRIVNGEPVMVDAEYAKISADAVARLFLDAFHVPIDGEAVLD